jgi:hypothetical protein
MNGNNLLFVGPTARGLSAEALLAAQAFQICSPVRRGDIEALTPVEPGVLVLVDGLFHDVLAVGHIELREAVARGWQVWGLSSMGAIRAYEMRTLGMRGYGDVYARFFAEEDFQDDEVSLLHAPAPDYTPISEPLVHLRSALDAYVTAGMLSAEQSQDVAQTLKSLWYGERTLDLFFRLLRGHVGPSLDASLPHLRADFDRHRLKTHDLDRFLINRVWQE